MQPTGGVEDARTTGNVEIGAVAESPRYTPGPSPGYAPGPSPGYAPGPSQGYTHGPSPGYAPGPSPGYAPVPPSHGNVHVPESPGYHPGPSPGYAPVPPNPYGGYEILPMIPEETLPSSPRTPSDAWSGIGGTDVRASRVSYSVGDSR
ncbi:hypothetical protein R1sor_006596 [Riccia sorocarpa]|uniref:Uncharacterized protein n=1 Tax=Riccia sorocarpa TaxID=122646 RepID=A0ABD3HS81_9MARC